MSKQTFATENNKKYKEFKSDLENFSNLCKTHAESFKEIIELLTKCTKNHPLYSIAMMTNEDIMEYSKAVFQFDIYGKVMKQLYNNQILETWEEMKHK